MKEKYHFIAIGGIGMSGLAKILLQQGFEVTGSDSCDSKYIHKIELLGAKVSIGHDAKNVPSDAKIVVSSAIHPDNPELLRAKALGLKILHRSDLLAEIANNQNGFIGFCGMHGKTTTSGLAAYVTQKAGYAPSFVVGGIVPELDTNAMFANGKFFIAELDESDGTIVKYTPKVLVINNLEADHMDFYKEGLKSVIEVFDQYISTLDSTKIIVNTDCAGIRQLKNRNFITIGLKNADYTARNIVHTDKNTTFDVYYKGKFVLDITLKVLGDHNVYNALAVFAGLIELGMQPQKIKPHFASFTGMGRRFQLVGEVNGITIYDDYAHHPTEIKATTQMTKHLKRPVVAVFQPHRYTRLKSLWDEFLNAFDGINRVIVTDIYEASEYPIEGITSEAFTKELSEKVNAEYLSGTMAEVAKKLMPTLKSGDVVVGLGAGTITELGKELLKLGN